jgi:hypothetical protein
MSEIKAVEAPVVKRGNRFDLIAPRSSGAVQRNPRRYPLTV